VGFWFSARTGFFQLSHMPFWLKSTFGSLLKSGGSTGKKEITPFQALSGALAACMGTGNIVGVATAIILGGPGAIFWMWLSSILGMMTAFAENTLGIKTRYRLADGEYMGGGMVILERGAGLKRTASLWCVLLVASSFGVGNMTQGNSAAATLKESFGLAPAAVGITLAALTVVVSAGGIKRVTKVAELVVPALSLIFLLGCLALIAVNIKALPGALWAVLRGAKSPAAMRWGIARGVFSNEAGLGTAPLIHASASCKHPAEQGLWGIAEVFADTTVMCVITGMAILCSGAYAAQGEGAAAVLCGNAFASTFGGAGRGFVAVALCVYAFGTLLGWSQYGGQGMKYLLRGRGQRLYLALFAAAVFVGCVVKLETVWLLSDIFNALMAFPNLLGIILLRREALEELKKLGVKNMLNPLAFGGALC
jgi:AGCS family alanine or glycine:cation symporter